MRKTYSTFKKVMMDHPFQIVILTALIIGFSSFGLQAQSEGEEMISSYSRKSMPSPTAASFAKFEEVPVDLYTGIPKIAIPLYKFGHRDLSVPIVLRSHGGGIKASERAGWTGLGWNLDVGGVLTRVVRGRPDEQTGGYLEEVNYLKDNWNSLSKSYRYQVAEGNKDAEPDLFSFSAPGISGKFSYQYNGEIGIIPKQDIRIEKNGDTWILTGKDGTQYIFNEPETSTMMTESPGGNPGPMHSYISSWYLTEIKSPSGNNKIVFNYASSGSGSTNTEVFSYQKLYVPEATVNCPAGPEPERLTVTSSTVNSKYLKSIRADYSTSVTRVEFLVSNRDDLANEKKLDQIKVFRNDTKERTFSFTYGYFNTNASNNLKRLKLEEVQEEYTGNDKPNESKPPYTFTYYNPDDLPSYDTFSIDHWGFYNGQNNSTLIPAYYSEGFMVMEGADRSPDFSYGLNGVLKSISRPLGSEITLEYEPHTYQWIGSEQVSDPVYAKNSETVPSLDGANKTQDSRDFTLISEARVKVQYSLTGGNGVEPYAEVRIANLATGSTEFIEATGSQGTKSGQVFLNLTAGDYRLKAERGLSGEDDAHISAEWSEIVDTQNTKIAGGIRIKKIISDPAIGEPLVQKFEYKMSDESASGVLVSEPRYLSSATVSQEECSKWVFSSNSVVPLGSTNGSHIGYRRVITKSIGEGQEGVVVNAYRSPYEVPDQYETTRDWKRGQLVEKTITDASGKKIRQLEHDYYFTDSGNQLYQSAPATKLSAHLETRQSLNGGIEVTDTLFSETAYHVISGWTDILQKKKIDYDVNDQSKKMISYRRFYYSDSLSHLQPTRITAVNSEGSERIREYVYAHEQYSGMASDHMLSQPYSVTTKDGNHTVLNKEWILWDVFYHNSTPYWRPAERRVLKGAN